MFDKDEIVAILKRSQPTFPELARRLAIPRDKNNEFSKFLFSLVDSGVIFMTPDRSFFAPIFEEKVQGILRLNVRGFGFIDLEDERSIFIAPTSVNTAMDGDEVVAEVFKDPSKPGQFQGVVREILTRSRTEFVGRVMKFGEHWGIKPFDARINGKFRFIDESQLKVDDEVKVRIISYGTVTEVELMSVIGNKDDVSVDILVAIEDSGIPYEFKPDTIIEAKSIPLEVEAKDLEGRTDLRNDLIVTIDGDDTKDFDDAIEVRKLPNGNYYLGVHIADVTNYVKEGNPLDDEAKNRGTSVYLADRVIPMLPEALSNGICSLNPNVDRLTLSCDCEIDPQGNTVSYKIYPSVIKSKYRLTYQQVNAYYRGNHTWEDDKLHKMLNEALELSRIIRKYKNVQGYIDFEIEESKIIIDDQGKTVDIVPRERLESEMMIEDFMVRANETVAFHTESNKLAFIYRVHDKPDIEKVQNLQNVVKVLGMEVRIPTHPIPMEFAKAINQIKQTRFDDFMKIMMLRTMAKAEYSPKNIGHFGLASTSYTHFTSPIRRYPDLMVHRMLREYFFNNRKDLHGHFTEILGSIAEHSSMTEQRAMELERKVDDIKKAEFYEQFIGQSFEGTIVSMLKFGFFVEFPNKVDGLVHVSNLVDGDYKLTDSTYSITNGKRTFTVGDKVQATVVAAVKDEGKIDLVLSDMYEAWKEREAKMMKNFDGSKREDRPRRDGDKKDFGPRRDGERRGFGPRRDGDKKDFGPRRDGERRSFGDKPRFDGPRRDFGPRRDGEKRDFAPRAEGERREFTPRAEGDRRSFGPRDNNGPRRSFGDKPRFDGPRRSFGDKPRFDGPRRDGEKRDFAPRAEGERREFTPRAEGDRRSFGPRRDGERREFTPRAEGERRSFGPRKDGERRSFGPRDNNGPRRSFGDKPRFDGPRRDRGDR